MVPLVLLADDFGKVFFVFDKSVPAKHPEGKHRACCSSVPAGIANHDPELCCMGCRRSGWGRMKLGVLRFLSGVGPCRSKTMPSVATTSQSSGTAPQTLLPTMRPCGGAAALSALAPGVAFAGSGWTA